MRVSIVLVLITIALAGCANTEILRDPHACWQHHLSEKNYHNVVTFCVAADKAAKSVFFPNASFPGIKTNADKLV
ncbi:MAG: hypothetical protein IPP88_06265 [Betaproteobacteria bacterium]|nr:hypothetical protein [Betaproteobacteria bacterium]